MIDVSKAKPILFSTPMVQAILAGRKTMTRRVVKLPDWAKPIGLAYLGSGKLGAVGKRTDQLATIYSKYMPGTILYVRETWYYENHMHDLTAGEPDLQGGRYSHRYIFKADNPDYPVDVGVGKHGWQPSIFMPREAARIFLRVTGVRAEPVQFITEEDARAEGVELVSYDGKTIASKDYKTAFHWLWDSLNHKRGYGWLVNPWVWVYEFEDISEGVK